MIHIKETHIVRKPVAITVEKEMILIYKNKTTSKFQTFTFTLLQLVQFCADFHNNCSFLIKLFNLT